MKILEKLFGKSEQENRIPYYWGTETLEHINKMLSTQIADLENLEVPTNPT